MAVKKFAISMPEEVMEGVDRAARRLGLTRSRFIADTLRRVASARSEAEISRRIDAFFADPAHRESQAKEAAAFRSLGRSEGTEW